MKMCYRPEFECQNRTSNVKIRYLAKVRIYKQDLKRRNRISNVKMKCDIQPEFEFKNMVLNVKCDIRPEFECQNIISNVKMRYSAPVQKS